MIKITGNDVWRGGDKIGYIEENRIYSHDGVRLGYFEGTHVYNKDADKTAYIENDHLINYTGGSSVSLETINEKIQGGVLSEIGKCAIYVLLGS